MRRIDFFARFIGTIGRLMTAVSTIISELCRLNQLKLDYAYATELRERNTRKIGFE